MKAAIDANGVMREKKDASVRFGEVLAEYEDNTQEARGAAVDALLRGVGKDRDLLALLQFNGCQVIRGLLLDGGRLRAEGDVAERLEGLRRNVDELRAASRGNRRIFAAGLRQLVEFNGKPLPDGSRPTCRRTPSSPRRPKARPTSPCAASRSRRSTPTPSTPRSSRS